MPEAAARAPRPPEAPDPLQLLSDERRPARADGIAFTRAGESAVLLDPRAGEYFALTEVGATIWELCDGGHTVEEIVAGVADEYDAPLETIRADTLELLHELEAAGLLKPD